MNTSGMMELLTAHCIEFNDRVIVVEETERGVKLRAIGRGFKADYDYSRNKWICYTPIPSGFRSAYKEKFSERFDSEYRVYIDELSQMLLHLYSPLKMGILKMDKCTGNAHGIEMPLLILKSLSRLLKTALVWILVDCL